MGRYRSPVLFVVLSAVWGAAFVAIKAGLEFFPPVLFAAIRYDVAGVLLIAYALYATDHPVPRGRREWLVAAGAGGVFMMAGYHALLFVGQQFTTSAVAAVVVGLNPVLTTAFARWLLPSERLRLSGFVGILLGLAGVVVLAAPDPANLLDPASRGPVLIFAATASFALGSVLSRRSTTELPIETMSGWSMLAGAVVMHAISLALGESPFAVAWTVDALLALGYLSIVASAVGFLIYFDLLSQVGPVEINLVSYVAPLFAAVVGVLLLEETVTGRTVAGFFVIITGFALLKHREIAAELGIGDAGHTDH